MKLKNKDDVYLLLNAATLSAALDAAIETGLLWRLAAAPMTAPAIAQALNIPGKRCHYWLQVLDELGILQTGAEGYGPSPLTREVILNSYSQASWQHLALDERERSSGVHHLSLFLAEPGSVWAAQGLTKPEDYVQKMRASPARAREFTRMLFEVHQNMARQIAERMDVTGAERMLDLGGGSGVVSMALLKKYPALTSTVLDIENVCAAGREIAAEEGLSDRLSFYPVEFGSDSFPAGYDLALQCDVGMFGAEFFEKVWSALRPGGRLILVEHFSPNENAAPPTRLEWTFLDSLDDPNFSFPTLDQVKAQLVQAGFQVSPDPQTFGTGWIILEACKVRPR